MRLVYAECMNSVISWIVIKINGNFFFFQIKLNKMFIFNLRDKAYKHYLGSERHLQIITVFTLDKILIISLTRACRFQLNGWQLAKMKKSIPDMSLPWNL